MAIKISKRQFEDLAGSLAIYFEHKSPSQGAVDAWYEKVQWVSFESLPFIYKKMTDDELILEQVRIRRKELESINAGVELRIRLHEAEYHNKGNPEEIAKLLDW